jgi:hypothetical protein
MSVAATELPEEPQRSMSVPEGFSVRPVVAGDETTVAELMNTFDVYEKHP